MKSILLTLLCAAILVSGTVIFLPEPSRQTVPEVPDPTVSQPSPPASFDRQCILLLEQDGDCVELNLEEYLVGVLLAEMPTDFPMEALKAQAIASRTFALKKADTDKHTRGHVCASASCCQGFGDKQLYDAAALSKITRAVQETDGLVLTYEGELIDATFFSCSGGLTEAAVEVWGEDVAYLQSVSSPGEEDAPPFTDTVQLSPEEFSQRLHEVCPGANLSGAPSGWFGAADYTRGGGINWIFIGGTPVTGRTLRELFSLRSTDISIQVQEGQIFLTTRGFGHRVGLSQYGAKAMAEAGADFRRILLHYYTGTRIFRLQEAL